MAYSPDIAWVMRAFPRVAASPASAQSGVVTGWRQQLAKSVQLDNDSTADLTNGEMPIVDLRNLN